MQTQEAFTIKNYTDREAMENNTLHSTLFIHFSANSIKTVVASKNKNAVFGLRMLEVKDGVLFNKTLQEIKSFLDALEFNKHDYANTKLIIENNFHALVPEALFVGEKADAFLKLNVSLGKNQKVLFNRLQKNRVSVFALNEEFHQSLKTIFPQSEIIHETELLLNLLHAKNQKENKDQMFVHVHDTYIDIVYFKNNDLNFLNTFRIEADTDIIYFVLSAAELLKLNQEKLHVSLFGNINNNGSLTGLMKKYISIVELMKRPEEYSYPASFREFHDHQYYLQICSLLCAS